ncbi:MAG: hypothetical protein IJW01_00630 [Paludibacteraceae bacterium]|nr:hypothetical protein [Paludibacteraceae bacterium]
MKKGLEIYACSGNSLYSYYEDNISYYDRKLNVNAVLRSIESKATEIDALNLTDSEVIERLNDIDLYVLCLYAIHHYSDELYRANAVLNNMLTTGVFNSAYISDYERDTNLDVLIDTFDALMLSEDNYKQENTAFSEWFRTTVIDCNYCPYTEELKQKSIEWFNTNKVVSGVGSSNLSEDEFNEYLSKPTQFIKNMPGYFTYTYISDDDIDKYPYLVRIKRKKELEVKEYLKYQLVGMVYATVADFENAIRSYFIAEYGETPEDFIKGYEQTRYDLGMMVPENGIGAFGVDDITIIICVAILAAALLISSIVESCLQYSAMIKSAEYSVPADGYKGTVTEEENKQIADYYNQKTKNTKKEELSIFPIIALGAGALILVNTDKKKRIKTTKKNK